MFESYEDILTIQDVAALLKVGKDWKIAKPALIEYVSRKSRLSYNK